MVFVFVCYEGFKYYFFGLVQKCCFWGCGCRKVCVNLVIINLFGKWFCFYYMFCFKCNVYIVDKNLFIICFYRFRFVGFFLDVSGVSGY